MRITAVGATLTVAAVILAGLLQAPDRVVVGLFCVAAFPVGVLLVRGYALSRELAALDSSTDRHLGKVYVLAHTIPVSYLVALYIEQSSVVLNLIFFVPFLFFYYTGRRLWGMLHRRFGISVYKFFFLGHSGLMAGVTVGMLLALIYPRCVGPSAFTGLSLFYLAGHFLLTGVAIDRLTQDLGQATN